MPSQLGNNTSEFWNKIPNGLEEHVDGHFPPVVSMKAATMLQVWKENPSLVCHRLLSLKQKKLIYGNMTLFGFMKFSIPDLVMSKIQVTFSSGTLEACKELLDDKEVDFILSIIKNTPKFKKTCDQKVARENFKKSFRNWSNISLL